MIAELIKQLFSGVDSRDWENVISVFDDNVLLDYSSMNEVKPSLLSPKEIIGSWSSFLPGFDRTNHQLSDFSISKVNDLTTVTFTGKADHFIGNSVWTVEGDYVLEINKNNKVSSMTFNFNKQSGDIELPRKASEIMQNRIR